MKRHIISALLIGGSALLALASCQAPDEQAETASQLKQGSTEARSSVHMLDNIEIRVPDVAEPVQLRDGTGEFQVAPGSSKGRVTLIEGTQRTWQSSNRTDLITAMTINSGGSGTFTYIALYSIKDGAAKLEDSAFLGDRIKVTSVGIGELVHDPNADYRITVQILERGENEPMAVEPDTQSKRIFYVTNGKLTPVSPVNGDT